MSFSSTGGKKTKQTAIHSRTAGFPDVLIKQALRQDDIRTLPSRASALQPWFTYKQGAWHGLTGPRTNQCQGGWPSQSRCSRWIWNVTTPFTIKYSWIAAHHSPCATPWSNFQLRLQLRDGGKAQIPMLGHFLTWFSSNKNNKYLNEHVLKHLLLLGEK